MRGDPGGEGGLYTQVQDSDGDIVTDTGDSEIEVDERRGDHRQVSRSLSQPTFQPIRSEGTLTDSEADTGSKRVRFARVAEVRSMSAKEALHANLARLSYAASVRAQGR